MNLYDINNDLFLLSTELIDRDKIDDYSQLNNQISKEKLMAGTTLSKIDSIRKELIYLIKEMKKGKLVLDPNIAIKESFKDNERVLSLNKSQLGSNISDKKSKDD